MPLRVIQLNKGPGTNHLQAERFRYHGVEFTIAAEIVTKEGNQDGRKGLSVRCVGKE
jgi:hypothetical protein